MQQLRFIHIALADQNGLSILRKFVELNHNSHFSPGHILPTLVHVQSPILRCTSTTPSQFALLIRFTQISSTPPSRRSSQSTTTSQSQSDSDLPFPAPLSREAFSQPTFDPTTYLTDLVSTTPRFQTLSDLHADLDALSRQINDELVEVVNERYAGVLGAVVGASVLGLGGEVGTPGVMVGSGLRGGEERVQEVIVGLRGVEKGIGELKGRVEREMDSLRRGMEELRSIRRQMEWGRTCLEVDERVEEAERNLGIFLVDDTGSSGPKTVEAPPRAKRKTTRSFDEDDEDDDMDGNNSDPDRDHDEANDHLTFNSTDEDEDEESPLPPHLRHRIHDYRIIRLMLAQLGRAFVNDEARQSQTEELTLQRSRSGQDQHPFLAKQQERLSRIRGRLLSELEQVMRSAETDGARREIIKCRIGLDEDVKLRPRLNGHHS